MSIKFKNEKLISNIFLLSILSYSFFLSFVYSTYHIDPWHWGTIASEATDYILGFKLFKEITLMYGPGMPIFFKFINFFYPINYFTIGIITSIIYLLNLFISYLIFLKLSNRTIASILLLVLFILNPYPQVPWSDFYAGTCLTLCAYFMFNSERKFFLYLSGLFLFLSIIFRNTYLLTIFPAIISFLLIMYFLQIKICLEIKKIFYSFIFFFFIFLIILFLTQNLQLWFQQGIGRSGSYFEYGYSLINNPITKFFYHLIIPKTLGNFLFLVFYIINFIFIVSLFFSKKKLNNYLGQKKLFILALFGLFGIIQSFDQFEVWRNLNSSIGIFFTSAYIFHNHKNKILKKIIYYSALFFFIGFFFFVPNPFYAAKFYTSNFSTFGHMDHKNYRQPNLSWAWKKYSKNNFKKIDVKFFGSHRFSSENIIYYKNMRGLICKYDKIINLTMDRSLVYICNKKNGISSTYSDRYPPKFFDSIIQNKIETGDIDNQTIILANKNFRGNGLKLLKVESIPKYTRYSKSALYMGYFDNEIYIYVK